MQKDSLIFHNSWVLVGQWVVVPVAGKIWDKEGKAWVSQVLEMQEGAGKGYEIRQGRERLSVDRVGDGVSRWAR